METSAALSQSMRHITTTKLNVLAKQQQSYEMEKHRILNAIAMKRSLAAKVNVLLQAFEKNNIQAPANLSIPNIHRFLAQSRHDTSVSPKMLREWHVALINALNVPSQKYEHASLFGRLVMEWLRKTEQRSSGSFDDEPVDDHLEDSDRKEMHEQRQEWESIVFQEGSRSDPAVVREYLANIFGSASQSTQMTGTSLETLRESIKSFALARIDEGLLRTCITSLLKTDLFSEGKRSAIVDCETNPRVLKEIVDVVNMQIDGLDSWSWGDEPTRVEVRRALDGKYHVYMDEELLQAILLHYIGMRWAVHLKTVFTTFFHSGEWKESPRVAMDPAARHKRQSFLGSFLAGHYDSVANVRNERRRRFEREFFLSQLPNDFQDTSAKYEDADGSEAYEFESHLGISPISTVPPNESENSKFAIGRDSNYVKSPSTIKQSLLRLITTEFLVNNRLYGSFLVLKSDFKQFGPSLPHATIITVLHFFGVTPFWLKFFQRFLEAPVNFFDEGPNSPTRIRRSGIPIQHRLSDALGEAVLFCLDFAVNKLTGANLYRMHDDIWFWGSRNASEDAYLTLLEFAVAMGLKLNHDRTGSVEIVRTPSDPGITPSFSKIMPPGMVHWGLLSLDSAGEWTIDDELLEVHILELRRQLDACRSIFAWVQVWNSYVARFISNNLGQPAYCLGRQHVDIAIQGFKRIQQELFVAKDLAGGNVTEHLKSKLTEKFGVTDIPDGFLYFPIELGGLGLINPFVPFLLGYQASLVYPFDLVDRAFKLDEADYAKAKEDWESDTNTSMNNEEPFLSLEEYTNFREETSVHLYEAYIDLLNRPSYTPIEFTPDVAEAIQTLELVPGVNWRTPEKEWIFQLYGSDIIKKYGGFELGEKRLFPIGLATMLRERLSDGKDRD